MGIPGDVLNWDSWGDQVGLFDNKKQQVNTRKRPSKWIETREQLKLIREQLKVAKNELAMIEEKTSKGFG